MDFVECVSQSPNDSERSVTTRILLQWINKIYFTVSLFSLFSLSLGGLIVNNNLAHSSRFEPKAKKVQGADLPKLFHVWQITQTTGE